ncbi:hypothetical protein VOLCADRAFT_104529 [Volvox carteri f. nagariensis]|uniref:Uncharacterized protein n=1 Tax=Volvox carteri f. nagariensis TaxID=3068 RepID=D8TU78_VOLCA|nr:uncharacterized protein VOLCADRAFT_104529 [Volvox carteri f. nagariensis]EFJ49098.1 hypothetical protein VOLCADRAFT_104529 [Volvox carteri f. nagariensis]|eukprot:XP_002949995.1 hypothetical protein VOLCADRAFT_104529 [Volvox carteri f. nagariensis]
MLAARALRPLVLGRMMTVAAAVAAANRTAAAAASAPAAASLWELEYQELALMALHTGKLAAAARAGGAGGSRCRTAAADGGPETPWLTVRSLGYTVPAANVSSLKVDAAVTLTVPPTTSLATAMPPPPPHPVQMQVKEPSGGPGAKGAPSASAAANGCGEGPVSGGECSTTRTTDLSYFHSLITYQPQQMRMGISVLVPEAEERGDDGAAAAAAPSSLPELPARTMKERNSVKRAAATVEASKVLCKRMEARVRSGRPVLAEAAAAAAAAADSVVMAPMPGSVAPVMTPLAACMLEDLMTEWPAYDSTAAGGAVGAAAGATQPHVLYAPKHLVSWASELRPWPEEKSEQGKPQKPATSSHPHHQQQQPQVHGGAEDAPRRKKIKFIRRYVTDGFYVPPHQLEKMFIMGKKTKREGLAPGATGAAEMAMMAAAEGMMAPPSPAPGEASGSADAAEANGADAAPEVPSSPSATTTTTTTTTTEEKEDEEKSADAAQPAAAEPLLGGSALSMLRAAAAGSSRQQQQQQREEQKQKQQGQQPSRPPPSQQEPAPASQSAWPPPLASQPQHRSSWPMGLKGASGGGNKTAARPARPQQCYMEGF